MRGRQGRKEEKKQNKKKQKQKKTKKKKKKSGKKKKKKREKEGLWKKKKKIKKYIIIKKKKKSGLWCLGQGANAGSWSRKTEICTYIRRNHRIRSYLVESCRLPPLLGFFGAQKKKLENLDIFGR